MKMFKGKNNLDEMQEQQLLHIEKNGFWMLYFLLPERHLGQTADAACSDLWN